MLTLNDSAEPLMLRRVRTSGQQHRIAACQYGERCLDLFLRPGQQSDLRILEHIGRKRRNGIASTKSRNNTSSTLVNEDEFHQPAKYVTGVDVPVKDIAKTEVLTATQLKNAEQLRQTLPSASNLVAFQIPQRGSWSGFSVTQDVFDALCAHLDVFPALRDTIMNMGSRNLEVEVSPAPLRWQSLGEHNETGNIDGWETSYTLRYIQQNQRPGGRPWSLRQFAVYNKCESAMESSSWILVAPPGDIVSDFRDVADHQGTSMIETNISVHVSFLDTAIAYFRQYLAYLTTEVDEHVSQT